MCYNKSPQTGLLTHLILIALKSGSPRLWYRHGQVLEEGHLPGLQMASFSLYPHKVESRERSKLSHVPDEEINPIHDLITSQTPHLQILSHRGLGFQHKNFEGIQKFSPQQKEKKNGSIRNVTDGIHWIQEWTKIEGNMGIRERKDSGVILCFLVQVTLWPT